MERLESQIISSFGSNKTIGPKQDSQIGDGHLHVCLRGENLSFINKLSSYFNANGNNIPLCCI
jgi:hypothetical protein